ncbi:MAG: O-antigen ligase family protein [Candidatus Riflebacteria bacterium]|nr:O-antigen ligase family protein [Candidatus Riflebacteria bacterium]
MTTSVASPTAIPGSGPLPGSTGAGDQPPPGRDWGEPLLHGGLYLYAAVCGFSISAGQISLGLAFFGLLRLLYTGRRRVKTSFLDIPFACFAIAGLFSLTNAVEPARAAEEMKKFLIILVFWVVYWADLDRKTQWRCLAVLTGFGMLSAVSGLLKMVYLDEGWHQIRAYGFFSLPITFGECQALLALTALAWLGAGDDRPLVRVAVLLAFHLLLAGILVSLTRGAWLGFGVGFLALVATFPRRLLPIGLVIALACAGAALSAGRFAARFGSFDLETNYFRLRIWQVGYDIFSEFPVFGVGMNNVKPHYRVRATAKDWARNEVHGHLHNTFLQILAMTGLFGFTAFCWVLVSAWRFCRHVAERLALSPWQAALARAGPAIFLGFLATGLTEYSFGDEEVAMLAFFLLGLAVSPYTPRNEEAQAA